MTLPNRLPIDGEVLDHGIVWAPDEADALLRTLLTQVPWQHDQVVLYGKTITTARQVCWMGDAPYRYRYSGDTKQALPWPEAVLPVKARVEAVTGERFNSCLANLYPTGQQGVSWHSDAEPELGPTPTIASVSFGAARRFVLRHRRQPLEVDLLLRHGSLIVMRGQSQACWKHQLPKMARVHAPRVNLTFRQMLMDG
jgi:alkylated DNA repair dioxygenase AlkB